MEFIDVTESKPKETTPPDQEKKSAPEEAPLPVIQGLDIEAARKRFSWVDEQLDKIIKRANEIVIEDEQTMNEALNLIGDATKLGKRIDELVKNIIDKPDEYVKGVKAFGKIYYDTGVKKSGKINKIEGPLRRKIGVYQNNLEMERRKKEKEEQDARKALQEKMDEEAKQFGIESPKINISPPPIQETNVIRSDGGTSVFLKRPWKFEITDPAQVPREYCSPDGKKLKEAVSAGMRKIAGVRIYQDISTNIRTN